MAEFADTPSCDKYPGKAFRPSWWGAASLLLIPVFLAGCGGRPSESRKESVLAPLQPRRVVGIGRVEPDKRFLDLRAETAGIVVELNVQPGDIVQRGDPLLRLSFDVEQAKVDLAASRIATQQAQLQAAEAALSALRIRTANSRIEYERAKSLYEQDAEARAFHDRAKTEYEALSEEIKQREADVRAAASLIQQYREEKKLAEAERAKRTIAAPENGTVLSLDISRGSYASPERTFGTFAPEGARIVRAEIDELFAERLRLQLKAIVRRPGETEILSEGRLIFIGPSFQKKSLFSDEVGDLEDRRIREVWLSLETDPDLLYGMRVECVIDLE